MSFLGLKKGPENKETKASPQNRNGTLVRPIPSLPKFNSKSYGSQSLSTYLGNGSIPLSQLSVHAKADRSRPQPAAALKTPGWPLPEGSKESVSVAGGAPQKQSATVERPFLDKPLEELTDGDIMQLTREDCRRYLKEKGMRRPSWNKFQAIQQVLSLKGLLDSKTPNEKDVPKEESSTPKDCVEAASDDVIPPLLRTKSIGSQDQGVTGEINSVRPFFSSTKGELGLENSENLRLFANGQWQLPQGMDEENGSPCHPDSTSSLPESDLTLSLSSSWVKGPPPSLHTGFGSPLPVSLTSPTERPGSTLAAVQSMSVRNGQGHSLVQNPTESGARPTSAHVMPPPATQMTIFYAGMVNVYDDIPGDKAQAIMLLAGCGNPQATSVMQPPASKDYPISAPPLLGASPTVPASSSGDQCRDANPPTASTVVVDPAATNEQCARPPHTELPQARRVSMQRFLEKRKERALAKAPYSVKNSEFDDSSPLLDPSFGKFPCLSKSLEAGSASLVPLLHPYLSATPDNRPLKSSGSKNPSRDQRIVLNSKEDKGCKRVEVENQSENLETVNSVDAEIIESEEDSAYS